MKNIINSILDALKGIFEIFLGFMIPIVLIVGIVGVIILVLSFPLKWLWNSLMPIIFDLPEISYWQSLGILLLSFILFGRKGPSEIKK